MTDSPHPKDCWDKFQILGNFIALLLVPIVLAIVGYFVDETLKEQETRTEYIKIASSILRDRPSPDARAMRSWAIEVLKKYSEIPLDQDVVRELEKTALPDPSYLTDHKGNIITDNEGNPIELKE